MDLRPLRPPLVLNASFSAGTGVILLSASHVIGSWLGPQTDWIYLFLGVGLLLFATALAFISIRPAPIMVLAITAADFGWIISTTSVLVTWRHSFTNLGWDLVLGTNAVVFGIAWLQLRSIRKAFQAPGNTPNHYRVCLVANAPVAAGAFWRVLADIGNIQRYMPSLRRSSLTVGAGPGVGCVRTCENRKGQVWSERCEAWEEGKAFDVVFLADAPEFPFPFSRMRGGWRVEPLSTGCQVEIWWHVTPRHPWAASILLPLFAAGAAPAFAGVVAHMTHAAQGVPMGPVASAVSPRLRAAIC